MNTIKASNLTLFNECWQFERNGIVRDVTLPHDWIPECEVDEHGDQAVAHFKDAFGTGVYTKNFTVGKGDWSLCFDGVMDQSEVFLNGISLYKNYYGYTSFEVPLAKALRPGEENTIEVRAVIEKDYTRFYAGAGIYRNVYLRLRKAGDGPYYEHQAVKPLPLPAKLNGVCLHADNGPLGMAATRESIERQLSIMKEMGANAIRTSHNPASPLLLDIAAEKGFYVMEEAFDYWQVPKTPGGYQIIFNEHFEDDIRAMVRRDRNRRNIIAWSLGNEVSEHNPDYCKKNGTEKAVKFGKLLDKIVKEEDPYRPTTVACWNNDSIFNGFDTVADIYGANYQPSLYSKFLENHPDKRIVGTETCSVLSSRGDYFFPLDAKYVSNQGPYKDGFVNDRVSSYDVSSCRPNNYSPDVEFKAQEDNPDVLGEFVWTGFDYLSEPTPYDATSRSSYYGIVDLCGFPKDRYYIYQAQWRPDFPMAHILPHWTWPGREGQTTPVHVYSSGDEAELFVNGISHGRIKRGPREYRFQWNNVVYTPGELVVKTWKKGKPWAEDRVVTAGKPAKVIFEQEPDYPSYYRISITDANGNFCPTAEIPVKITTTGNWRIKAVANGNAADHTPFVGIDTIKTYNGLAQVIIEKSGEGSVSADWAGAEPKIRFGVIADPHITTPESAALFEKSLRYCKDRRVDAVMVPGDLTDWGLVSGFNYTEATWEKVFGGTDVAKLFITGNHDYDGFWYGDMTMEMHANGYSEDDAVVKVNTGMAGVWESVFGEKFAPVRLRTVNGFKFLSAEWGFEKDLPAWLAENGEQLKGDEPFFYFQHPAIGGTTIDGARSEDTSIRDALKDFPNAIAFTAHTHLSFYDERCIWQDDFTTIASPSLSYNGFIGKLENFGGPRNGSCEKAMQNVPARRDLRGGQGFIVSVYDDRVEIERVDLEENGEQDAPTWTLPWPISTAKPYAQETYSKAYPAPEFPAGAELKVDTRNTEDRQGKWIIALNCEFPSAVPPADMRVYDYEIRVVPLDGSEPLVKVFLNPAIHKLARHETKRQRFWFNVMELPQGKDYVVEVYPRDCWGKRGKPLVSPVRHTCPGFSEVKR